MASNAVISCEAFKDIFSWQIRNLTLDRRRKLDDFQSKVLYRILQYSTQSDDNVFFWKKNIECESFLLIAQNTIKSFQEKKGAKGKFSDGVIPEMFYYILPRSLTYFTNVTMASSVSIWQRVYTRTTAWFFYKGKFTLSLTWLIKLNFLCSALPSTHNCFFFQLFNVNSPLLSIICNYG